jgi:NAD(P)-dependent dehydrogenase (short-subunit alcohol dehydrogenase family)
MYEAAHANPQGPGDARPTALKIVQDEGLVGKLTEKVVFVTGGNQGIGLETARAFHATGATVYIGIRDEKKGQEAVADILSSPDQNNKAPVHMIKMSLDSLDSVRAAASNFLSHSNQKLNILICNAGVMATPEGRTVDGFETQFGTNYLGHFLFFNLLKPALLASSKPSFNSRVVTVTSTGHRTSEILFDDYNFKKASYDPWIAYGQAKTAKIYFANEIERRYGSSGLHALSVHPGVIFTNLQQYVDPEIMKAHAQVPLAMTSMKSAAQGAATSVYAALSKEWEGRGGKYLSDCVAQGLVKPGHEAMAPGDDGYAAWAFDEEKAAHLWKDSCAMVGVEG